jgi:phage-related tail protein
VNPFLQQDPAQKARRLARALVSDMIVYQPDKRQRALAEGNLKQAFDEEIKKSWEEYVEQVGEQMANGTGYWREALNDILAGGQQVF